MKICLQSAVYDSVPKLSHRLRFILPHGKVIIDRTVISFSVRKFEVFESNYKTRNVLSRLTRAQIHNSRFFHSDLYARFPIANINFLRFRSKGRFYFYFKLYFEVDGRFR